MHLELTDLIYMVVTGLGSGGGGAFLMRRRMMKNGGNPGNGKGLSRDQREALYAIRDRLKNIDETLCKKDTLGAPLIFKIPSENKNLLRQAIRGLEKIKPGCTV